MLEKVFSAPFLLPSLQNPDIASREVHTLQEYKEPPRLRNWRPPILVSSQQVRPTDRCAGGPLHLNVPQVAAMARPIMFRNGTLMENNRQ